MSDTNVYQPVYLHVSNMAAGQLIWVELQEFRSPVAWSIGPAFESSSGISIQPSSEVTLPLTSVSINTHQVQINTSSDVGWSSSAFSFNIALYLVAQAGIQTFGLRSRCGPGISVQVSIGSAPPQQVGIYFSPVSWSQ